MRRATAQGPALLSNCGFVFAFALRCGLAWVSTSTRYGIAILLGAVIAAQFLCTKLFSSSTFDCRSALISGLSLCLLLRTNDSTLMILTAVITIASKFLLQWNGKHIFNPTNFGIIATLALTGRVWVSPAQWGSQLYFAFLIACLGGIVIHRAMRSDVSLAFIFSYAGILLLRALWLGDPWSIPTKQLQSGALLLFTFFMISDPKTTPDSRSGRILFALLVAAAAAYVQFVLYRNQWFAVVTGDLLDADTADRLHEPRKTIPMANSAYAWSRRRA